MIEDFVLEAIELCKRKLKSLGIASLWQILTNDARGVSLKDDGNDFLVKSFSPTSAKDMSSLDKGRLYKSS
jgi:hypothetical protein